MNEARMGWSKILAAAYQKTPKSGEEISRKEMKRFRKECRRMKEKQASIFRVEIASMKFWPRVWLAIKIISKAV